MNLIGLEELGIPRPGWPGRRRAIVVLVLEVAGLTAFFIGMLATVYVAILVAAAIGGSL